MPIKFPSVKIPIDKRIDDILNPEYVSELVGTFFLVFTVCINVVQKTSLAPLSIGAIVMCMIFATGGVSGGHYNPCVSVAVHLSHPHKFPMSKCLKYIAIQCASGLISALLNWWIMGDTLSLSPGHNRSALDAMSVEIFYSTALCLVVLNVATTKQDANNQYFGLAIGFTIVSSAFGIGPVSGCAINPAVSFGVMIAHLFNTGTGMNFFLVYFGTSFIGSFIGAGLFRLIRECEKTVEYVEVFNNKVLTA
jgi:aquaporin Z